MPGQPLPSVDTAEGFAPHREWERAAGRGPAGGGLLAGASTAAGTPRCWSGWSFEEEYHAAGAPVRVGQNGLFLLAPTLFAHGTAEQRDRLLPPMAPADEVWAQAWSEPEAGSDLAAIRSRGGPDRRRLAAVGQEDLELARGVRRPGVRAVPIAIRPARAAPRA